MFVLHFLQKGGGGSSGLALAVEFYRKSGIFLRTHRCGMLDLLSPIIIQWVLVNILSLSQAMFVGQPKPVAIISKHYLRKWMAGWVLFNCLYERQCKKYVRNYVPLFIFQLSPYPSFFTFQMNASNLNRYSQFVKCCHPFMASPQHGFVSLFTPCHRIDPQSWTLGKLALSQVAPCS